MKAVTKLMNTIFGKDALSRANIEEFKSSSRLKKAVNKECKALAEYKYDMYSELLCAVAIVVDTKKQEIEAILSKEVLTAPLATPETIDSEYATEEEVKAHREEWAVYNLKDRYNLLLIKEAVITDMQDGGKKLLVKLLKPIISAQARSKDDKVIVNAVIKSVSSNFQVAMATLSLLEGTNIFTLTKIKTLEGHYEFIVKYASNRPELRTIANQTDGRFPSLFTEKVTKDIVKRSKEQYVQAFEPVADVVDYLQSTALTLKDGLDIADAALESTKCDIKDEDGNSVMDAPWKRGVLGIYSTSYEAVEVSGRFYDKFGTDGVGRLYSESRMSIQSKATEHYIEFADKKPLNATGRKYIKLLIVDKAGYKIDGVKPTEEQALAYFEDNKVELYEAHPELFKTLKSRKATGFVLEVDAQTQGASIYGMTTLSLPLLTMTGLIGKEFRTDLYLALAKSLNKVLGVKAFDRNNVKSALMTVGYGAGFRTIMFGDGEFDYETGDYTTKSKSKKQVPLMVTAELAGITDTKQVWKAFKRAINVLVPDMVEAQTKIEALASEYTSGNTMTWVMPDGLECSVIDSKREEDHVEWIDNRGSKHSVKHSYMIPDNNNVKSASPRFIQAIDAYILRLVVRQMKVKGLTIAVNHDGYFVHPNDVEAVQFAYRVAATDVMKRDLLTDIARQAFDDESITSFQLRRADETELLRGVAGSKYSLWV